MQNPRNVLTPDALAMLQAIAHAGSFAAAARDLGVVPSALTYRVRVIEEAFTGTDLASIRAPSGTVSLLALPQRRHPRPIPVPLRAPAAVKCEHGQP